MSRAESLPIGWWLVAALVVAALLFSLWPQIDLWVSGLFYRSATGFSMAEVRWIELARNLVWNLSIGMVLLALVGLIAGWARRPLMGQGARVWGFVLALYLLAPILLVNGILKAHWGRARPSETSQFGGSVEFTPALLPADQCQANCSFVSGEVSAATVLMIAMLVLTPTVGRYLPDWLRKTWLFAAYALPFATALQRIASGRHFLSDAVFAGLFTLAVAWMLERLLLQPDSSDKGQ